MLQVIWPFGSAMFCDDISESNNRFLKHGHNEHSNRGGGHVKWRGCMRCRGVIGRPFTGSPVCKHNVCRSFLHTSMCHGLCTGGHGRKLHARAWRPHASFLLTNSSSSCPPIHSKHGARGSWNKYFAMRYSGDLGNRSTVDLGSAIGC